MLCMSTMMGDETVDGARIRAGINIYYVHMPFGY